MELTHFDLYVRALDTLDDVQGVLDEEWVVHPPKLDYGYRTTPSNSLTFAAMGVDGVHYVILTERGEVTDDSPVLQVSPMDSECYSVLGDSFVHFLSRGTGIRIPELLSVFDSERNGKPLLVEVLKSQFRMNRIRNECKEIDLRPFRRRIKKRTDT